MNRHRLVRSCLDQMHDLLDNYFNFEAYAWYPATNKMMQSGFDRYEATYDPEELPHYLAQIQWMDGFVRKLPIQIFAKVVHNDCRRFLQRVQRLNKKMKELA